MKLFYKLFRELKTGVTIIDENGNRLGESTKAAQQGIAAVTISRVAMSMPGMGNLLKFKVGT